MHSFQVGQLHAHVGLIISGVSFAASKPDAENVVKGGKTLSTRIILLYAMCFCIDG